MRQTTNGNRERQKNHTRRGKEIDVPSGSGGKVGVVVFFRGGPVVK